MHFLVNVAYNFVAYVLQNGTSTPPVSGRALDFSETSSAFSRANREGRPSDSRAVTRRLEDQPARHRAHHRELPPCGARFRSGSRSRPRSHRARGVRRRTRPQSRPQAEPRRRLAGGSRDLDRFSPPRVPRRRKNPSPFAPLPGTRRLTRSMRAPPARSSAHKKLPLFASAPLR
jgi:hypothetical protein